MEVEYWLRSILKQDKYTDEDSDVGVVPLTELLKHKKIANLCSTDVDNLRYFNLKNMILKSLISLSTLY